MAKVLHGDAGANQLNATTDKTQVYGLAGNDTLVSNGKSDVLLVGGSGDDSLIMSGGNGTLSGGAGKDTFELTYSADKKISAVIEDLVPSEDKIIVNFDGDTAPQLTSIVSGNNLVWRDGAGLFRITLKSVRENDYLDSAITEEQWADLRATSEEAWEVLRLTNDVRESQNLPLLTASEGLTTAAQIRSQEISKLGETGVLTNHTRPNGSQWYTVLDGKYNFPGENLDGGASSPVQVMRDWTGSASHYANIVNPDFKKLGVGYTYYDVGSESSHRYYWTQLFADSLNNPETVSIADLSTANIAIDTVSKFVTLTENPDTYSNADYGATIDAKGGGDSITNTGLLVSISGGNAGDTIDNRGNFSTINGGKGNDSIRLAAQEVLIQYAVGDGNDTVSGLNSSDTVSISGGEFTPATIGNDLIVAVGNDSITLTGAARSGVQILGERSNLFILTDDNDNFINTTNYATIMALGGDDSVRNFGNSVAIEGATGNDSVSNFGDSLSINGGAGNDFVYNDSIAANVTIDSGDGNDTILNNSYSVTIDGGAGNDIIVNSSAYVEPSNVSLFGGAGDDELYNLLYNSGGSATVNGGSGNDSIWNINPNATLLGGDGNDYIYNTYGDVSIDGGTGDDTIFSQVDSVTIVGGRGNDSMVFWIGAQNILIKYSEGDGNDTIGGFSETDTLKIGDGTGTYSTQQSGDYDIVVSVGEDSILLQNVASLSAIHIEGKESNPVEIIRLTQGDDTYSNNRENLRISALGGNDLIYNSSIGVNVFISGSLDDDTIENYGSEVIISGGYGDDHIRNYSSDNISINGGADDDRITNDYGLNATLDGNDGDDRIRNYSGDNSNINGGAGNDDIYNSGDSTAIIGGAGNDSIRNLGDSVTIVGGRDNDQISLRSYSRYNLIQYTAGEKIVFGDVYTGSFYDAAGNYFIGSSTGALVIQNAADKVIDLSDAAGNSFLKAYSATTAGVIDGRGLTGFEIINGSAGADAIFAGDGGSQLWGGLDIASDTMIGGGGTDIFIGGQTQGADVILNASSADIVHLNDANLSDIIATAEDNGAISVAFNTGNVIAVQSSELLSATFMLADGSAYRYNHATRNWQTA